MPENFTTAASASPSLDPALVGSTMAGTVTAASNGAPLARITVELWSAASGKFVTAVATASNGGYSLDAVLPGRYRLRFRAEGFEERWYPDATTATDGAGARRHQPGSRWRGSTRRCPARPAS